MARYSRKVVKNQITTNIYKISYFLKATFYVYVNVYYLISENKSKYDEMYICILNITEL